MEDQIYPWWQKGIIYQIYPRSYQDSNADGIGDLPGIHQRLDYIHSLGVDAIWFSPFYPSPMHDFGYDVADYTGIHPIFGAMADFDTLLAAVHERGMKLIIDLVPNHTSSEHPWFIESRKSRDNPKRDWYIWRDPAPDGGPPNNWLSYFGGPAWTYDKATGQYYLHQFVTQQPELNYRHSQVLPAMLNFMRFWLEKGVDGFRVDVIWLMLKDDQFRDNPPNPDWDGIDPKGSLQTIYTSNLPGVHDIIKQMRAVLDEYDDRMMVGEIYMPNEDLVTYYGSQRPDGTYDECHLPFNFQLIGIPWDAQTVRQAVDTYYAALPDGAWPNWVTGNHDCRRIASRVGRAQARIANMLLLTLWGTPTTYYGEEIGMQNGHIPLEFIQDPPAVKQPKIADVIGRDPVRTPMQWDSTPNAGFTTAGIVTWLPVAGNYQDCNVSRQVDDPGSMLNLYKTIVRLRQSEPALFAGEYTSIDCDADDIYAYMRTSPVADTFLVVLNFAGGSHDLNMSRVGRKAIIAAATGGDQSGEFDMSSVQIAPNQGLVLRVVR